MEGGDRCQMTHDKNCHETDTEARYRYPAQKDFLCNSAGPYCCKDLTRENTSANDNKTFPSENNDVERLEILRRLAQNQALGEVASDNCSEMSPVELYGDSIYARTTSGDYCINTAKHDWQFAPRRLAESVSYRLRMS